MIRHSNFVGRSKKEATQDVLRHTHAPTRTAHNILNHAATGETECSVARSGARFYNFVFHATYIYFITLFKENLKYLYSLSKILVICLFLKKILEIDNI